MNTKTEARKALREAAGAVNAFKNSVGDDENAWLTLQGIEAALEGLITVVSAVPGRGE